MAALAGCGGEDETIDAFARVQGAGYSFEAPVEWEVSRRARTIEAKPAGADDEAVSVTIFRLARPYRPALFPQVVPEIDGVVDRLAAEVAGRRTRARTVTVGGRRARSYTVEFEREGEPLVVELTFVLSGRREYQLLCRRRAEAEDAPACRRLVASFRPAASQQPAR